MTYATLCTAQKTYGVKVPYGHGTYTVHYDSETEALEVIEGLNRAYVAGWNAALRSVEREYHGLQNSRNPVSGADDALLRTAPTGSTL